MSDRPLDGEGAENDGETVAKLKADRDGDSRAQRLRNLMARKQLGDDRHRRREKDRREEYENGETTR
jgi:hypothetical protein